MEAAPTLYKPVTANSLKIIAVIAMFVDHASSFITPNSSPLDMAIHTFGRLAAPIMCYLIAEGYFYTTSIKKYVLRLAILSVISHFPFVWYFELNWLRATSVIWSLTLGLVALAACKSEKLPSLLKPLAVALCCLLAWTANWNFIAVLWIVSFGIFRGSSAKQMTGFSLIGMIYIIRGLNDSGWFSLPSLGSLLAKPSEILAVFSSPGGIVAVPAEGAFGLYRLGIFLAIPLFLFYGGKLGRKSNLIKWGFYAFYPLHLFALFLLRRLGF